MDITIGIKDMTASGIETALGLSKGTVKSITITKHGGSVPGKPASSMDIKIDAILTADQQAKLKDYLR